MKGVKGTLRPALHRVLGPSTTTALGMRLEDLETWGRQRFDAVARSSGAALRELHNGYAGKRCFIIGNGPSLKSMDLSPLQHELTFGLNRIYLMFEELGFATDFLVSINRHVIEQCASELAAQPCTKFISEPNRDLMDKASDCIFFRTSKYQRFSEDASRAALWEGATVTYVAMQLAFHMGFQEVVLIGVDHSFTTTGPAHQLVTSEGDDPNHFHPGYFGKGFRWQLPDLDTSEVAYRLAREHFERAGRRIVDATAGGKLTVFPKAIYEELVGLTAPVARGAA